MTEAEALERAEQHIADAVAQIIPAPSVEPRRRLDIPCRDQAGRDDGLYQVERRYWLHDLPVEDNRQTFDTLYAYWTDTGYEIVDDIRDRAQARALTAHSDGFTVHLLESVEGELSIRATSPCIRTSESPSDT
ncbi:hypothetical protein [Phytoactinopolyspora limicola]|uniref:hypothetical protein n=1 Tax=Phytoactinopolyspora limicola TaxID=2715536 RepID=UPI00140CE794|nr:hypothetical protein [Phytoactinopolyspora limicola]